MNWKDYLGRRVIVRQGYGMLFEKIVIEVSAEGRVKLKSILTDHIGWYEKDEYNFVEMLGDEPEK